MQYRTYKTTVPQSAAKSQKNIIIIAAVAAIALALVVAVFAICASGCLTSSPTSEQLQTTAAQTSDAQTTSANANRSASSGSSATTTKTIDNSKIVGSWYVPVSTYKSSKKSYTKCNPYDTITLNADGTASVSVEITDSVGEKNATVTSTGTWSADTWGDNYEVYVYVDGSKFAKYSNSTTSEMEIVTLTIPTSSGSTCQCTGQDCYFENSAQMWMDSTAYRSASSAKAAAGK